MIKHKCKCPDDSSNNWQSESMYLPEERIGMKHKPNECKCVHGLRQYLRRGKKIWLCSCCNIGGIDEEITKNRGSTQQNEIRTK